MSPGNNYVYGSPQSIWQSHSHNQWYSVQRTYWNKMSTDDAGMLGGFGELSHVDIKDSKELIKKLDWNPKSVS